MLKNYFKIAIAVLKRRKFFTFISLFGISFTLTILIVLSAFMDYLLNPQYPEINRDRSLYIGKIVQKSKDDTWSRNTSPSFYFLNNYVKQLKTPAKLSIASKYISTTSIKSNKKISIDVKFTNAEFWEVMKFNFLEGKAYNQIQVDNGEKLAVITKSTQDRYFGNTTSAIDEYIESDHIKFKVVGVVKNVPLTMIFTYADMYVPYKVSEAYKADSSIMGFSRNYEGILLAHTKSDLSKVIEEYQVLLGKVPIEDPKNYPKLFSHADPYLFFFTRNFLGNEKDSGSQKFYTYTFIVLLIFTLLPIVNLVNINISRMMERSSEIGIRKAFGASSNNLVFQFLVENVILTLMGGILSILFSLIILNTLNHSNLILHGELVLDKIILFYSLLAFLVFGIFSGVYPAWRMSKMNVVKALKV